MHSCIKYQSLVSRHKWSSFKIYIHCKLLVIHYLLRSFIDLSRNHKGIDHWLLENRHELNIAAVECKSEKHINIFIALHEDVHL